MNTVDTLVDFLNEIDGQGYKAYKGLRDTWSFPDFTLHVDHVQGDPFAEPSACDPARGDGRARRRRAHLLVEEVGCGQSAR